jgi:hypothetical protein
VCAWCLHVQGWGLKQVHWRLILHDIPHLHYKISSDPANYPDRSVSKPPIQGIFCVCRRIQLKCGLGGVVVVTGNEVPLHATYTWLTSYIDNPRNRNNVVCITTVLPSGRSGSNSLTSKRASLLQNRPDRLWDTKWVTEFFPVIKRPEREGDHSLLLSVEDRNERFYIEFLLYAFVTWTGKTSPFNLFNCWSSHIVPSVWTPCRLTAF